MPSYRSPVTMQATVQELTQAIVEGYLQRNTDAAVWQIALEAAADKGDAPRKLLLNFTVEVREIPAGQPWPDVLPSSGVPGQPNMADINKYMPQLRKAALMIMYDNGMVNRESGSEADLLAKLRTGLFHEFPELLDVEADLARFTDAQLLTLCVGEAEQVGAHETTVEVLDWIFEGPWQRATSHPDGWPE